MVVNADIKGLEGIDIELFAGAVAVDSTNIFDVNFTLTSEVTLLGLVPAILVRGIAGVCSGVESPSVGLHHVEFGTGFTAVLGLLRATVPVGAVPKLSILLLGWHEHLVESRDAATWQLAKIDVVCHVASQQIWFEVFVGVWNFRSRQISAVSVVHFDCFTAVNYIHVRPGRLVHEDVNVLSV